MVYGGNITQLSVAKESVALSVINTLWCLQVPGGRSPTLIRRRWNPDPHATESLYYQGHKPV